MKKLLAVLACFAAVVFFTGRAIATDQQDALVVDKANLFGTKLAEVEQAAQNLQNKGADVHVWTIQSFSGEASSLEGYYKKLEQSFPAWQSSDGGRKNNLIVLMISMKERKTGLYYGGEWSGPLKNNWLRIQTDLMNPKFKRKEFAEGFTAGLGEITRLADEHLHPSQIPPPQTVVVQQQALAKPTDLSGLWTVMAWALGILFLGTVVFFGGQAMKRREEKKGKWKRAQQRAKIEKGNATEKITSIRAAMNNLELLATAVERMMDDDSLHTFREKFLKAKDAQAKLAADFAGTENAAGDPNVDGLMETQYAAMEDKYKEVTDSSEQVLKLIRKLEEEVTSFRDLAMDAPKTLEALVQRAKEVEAVVSAVKDKGFKVDEVEQPLNSIPGLLQGVQEHFNSKNFRLFSNNAQAVDPILNQIEERALAISALKQALDKRADELENKGFNVTKIIAEAKDVFLAITKSFISRSWESVKGNGTEAENRVRQATAAVVSIRKCASMEVQDWKGGQELVEKADQWLNEAQSLMRSVISLKENLDRAKANVAKEVVNAENDIKKAWDYIKQYDADIRGRHEDDLRKAQKMIEEVKKELKKEMPDYTAAFKKAQDANALADKIYGEVVEEHESMERQRRKLVSQKQNTERKISKAKEYFEDHASDVGSGAKEHLSSAESNFQSAESSQDLNQMLALMLAAEEAADNAYNVAKDDVHNAHRSSSRSSWGSRREYESHNATIFVGGSSGRSGDGGEDRSGFSGHSSRSDDSGGGSSSFSGGDSGGGGSTDFGGGGDSGGGGGDSSW